MNSYMCTSTTARNPPGELNRQFIRFLNNLNIPATLCSETQEGPEFRNTYIPNEIKEVGVDNLEILSLRQGSCAGAIIGSPITVYNNLSVIEFKYFQDCLNGIGNFGPRSVPRVSAQSESKKMEPSFTETVNIEPLPNTSPDVVMKDDSIIVNNVVITQSIDAQNIDDLSSNSTETILSSGKNEKAFPVTIMQQVLILSAILSVIILLISIALKLRWNRKHGVKGSSWI